MPIDNRGLLEAILRSPQLPSLPAVALEVLELVERPDVSIDELAELIGHDPGLAAKLLKTVNSSFYAPARTITTIRDAIVLLGLNDVRTLALGFSLVDGLHGDRRAGFDHEAFWRRSLRAGIAARAVAHESAPEQSEAAFLGGLLGRLGVLAMAAVFGERYDDAYTTANGDFDALRSRESTAFGADHAQVGSALAERWNLPEKLCAALAFQDQPELAENDVFVFVQIVSVGDSVAGLFGGAAGPSLLKFRRDSERWFGLDRARGDHLLTDVDQQARATFETFELTHEDVESAATILSRADEALARLNDEAA